MFSIASPPIRSVVTSRRSASRPWWAWRATSRATTTLSMALAAMAPSPRACQRRRRRLFAPRVTSSRSPTPHFCSPPAWAVTGLVGGQTDRQIYSSFLLYRTWFCEIYLWYSGSWRIAYPGYPGYLRATRVAVNFVLVNEGMWHLKCHLWFFSAICLHDMCIEDWWAGRCRGQQGAVDEKRTGDNHYELRQE